MASHASHTTVAKKKIDEFKSSQLHGALKVHKSDMPDEVRAQSLHRKSMNASHCISALHWSTALHSRQRFVESGG